MFINTVRLFIINSGGILGSMKMVKSGRGERVQFPINFLCTRIANKLVNDKVIDHSEEPIHHTNSSVIYILLYVTG